MQKLIAVIALLAIVSTVEAQSFRPRIPQGSSQRSSSNNTISNRALELRVLIDDRSAVGTSHEWMQALSEVGADRVVAETSRVRQPSFEEYGSGSRKTLAVVGIVKQGTIHLPGGKFSIRQTAAIRNHLKKLRDDGGEVTVAEKVAFGLTAKQLLSVHDRLGVPVDSSTLNRNAGELANSILKKTGYPISIDRSTEQIISRAQSSTDIELEGFTLGTSLALTLRQIGLVFEPFRPQGKDIRLLVRPVNEKEKNWPVGWPISESRKKAAPKLFVKVSFQGVLDTEILKLLEAIEGRLDIPFVFDRARISAVGIDLPATKVSFSRPGKKSSYDLVIEKVLNQCKPKLKSEVRIDEAGKRFLWITPRK